MLGLLVRRRALPWGVCGALAVALAGAPLVAGPISPAVADQSSSYSQGGVTFTVSGDPVSFQGNNGVDCSGAKNGNKPAHLSGPLTVTLTSGPSSDVEIFAGSYGGYDNQVQGSSRTVFTIPVGGGGNHGTGFTCDDAASNNTFYIEADVANGGFAYINLLLTRVD